MKHMLYDRKAVPLGLLFFYVVHEIDRFFPVNNVYLRYHLHTIERRIMMGKEYVLMHKDVPVLSMTLDESHGKTIATTNRRVKGYWKNIGSGLIY